MCSSFILSFISQQTAGFVASRSGVSETAHTVAFAMTSGCLHESPIGEFRWLESVWIFWARRIRLPVLFAGPASTSEVIEAAHWLEGVLRARTLGPWNFWKRSSLHSPSVAAYGSTVPLFCLNDQVVALFQTILHTHTFGGVHMLGCRSRSTSRSNECSLYAHPPSFV